MGQFVEFSLPLIMKSGIDVTAASRTFSSEVGVMENGIGDGSGGSCFGFSIMNSISLCRSLEKAPRTQCT